MKEVIINGVTYKMGSVIYVTFPREVDKDWNDSYVIIDANDTSISVVIESQLNKSNTSVYIMGYLKAGEPGAIKVENMNKRHPEHVIKNIKKNGFMRYLIILISLIVQQLRDR